ncbi:MAG TPA: GAF domain-containing sensor histidine kinase [Dehalococcoidia bacterium]|nr:GAF domain-containing sensor histidine kinase [Dehalococcoidia bacterium]
MSLTAQLSVVLRVVWLALLISCAVLAVMATPALHEHYTVTCDEAICNYIAQPNANTVDVLDRAGIPLSTYATFFVALDWLFFVLWAGLGALIVLKRPADTVAMALAFAGVALGSYLFLQALAWDHPGLTLPGDISSIIAFSTLPLFLALFPDGRWVPGWVKWIALAGVLANTAGVVLSEGSPFIDVADLALPVIFVTLFASQVYRYRKVSNEVQRLQAKWLLFGLSLYISNFVVVTILFILGLAERYQLPAELFCYAGSMSMVVAIGFAVFRYRLFDIDVILNRAVVYVGLTLSVVAIYAAIVGGLGALLQDRAGVEVSFVAAAAIAIVFHPLRMRLQRAANRLVYGERDDPYRLVTHLGRRLEASLSPETVMPTIVETLASALRLPYAAIALGGAGTAAVAAEYGVRGNAPLAVVPLTYRGETVGELCLAPRLGERTLSRADLNVLEDLGRHAGVALHAVAVTRDLQKAREQVITAREEERRRLRRDLHDGLGPTLASQALTIDTAGLLMASDPEHAAALLRDAKAQSQLAVSEIRRLVYNLRPPALDDLGLVGALREAGHASSGGGLVIKVEAPSSLPSLSAASEVAALRIVQEALTNVARHARAGHCLVRLTAEDMLIVQIEDDGVGLAEGRRAGIGLISMRERAEELGGSCIVGPAPGGGTRVLARLPLAKEDA